MRKHRLYGVVFAVLLGSSLAVHRPGSAHHATGVDPGRTTIHLTSAALAAGAVRSIPTIVAVPAWEAGDAVDLLSPPQSHDEAALWSYRAALLAPPPPPPAPPPPPPAPVTKPARGTLVVARTVLRPAVRAAPPAPTAGAAGVWAALRRCESGGNYRDDTGNGFYGAYQFSLATWHGLGYGGLPSQASAAVQDQAAQRLEARSGWGQWPVCSHRLA